MINATPATAAGTMVLPYALLPLIGAATPIHHGDTAKHERRRGQQSSDDVADPEALYDLRQPQS